MSGTPGAQLLGAGGPDPRLRWLNEPPGWQVDPASGALRLSPLAGTDFWQRTHYGFEADNGHFLYLEQAGDFVLSTCVTSDPLHQYDQAGLMLRISPGCWIKTSVEFEPAGDNRLGAVVTNGGYSDWSTQPLAKAQRTVWLRLRAEGADCIADASLDGRAWQQLRVAHLHERRGVDRVMCGLYACSPQGAGYRATFASMALAPGRIG